MTPKQIQAYNLSQNRAKLARFLHDPRADRAAIQRWIDTMRQLPETQHTTGSLVVTERAKPCMCALGVQYLLTKELDPTTVASSTVRTMLGDNRTIVALRGLIPTVEVDDTGEFGPDQKLTDDFFWAIVYLNDAPLYLSFASIADQLQETLDGQP